MRNHLMMRAVYGLAAMAVMSPADGGADPEDNADLGEYSLADLADLDVSDIKEIRFETLPMGVYEFEMVSATLDEGVDNEGAKRFTAVFECKIVDVKAVLEPGVDKEGLIGKMQTEKFYMSPGAGPDKMAEAIGRVRAFVSDIGLDSSGKLGAMVANTKDHRWTAKIKHQKNREDKSIVYARMGFDAKKKG